MRQVSAWRQSLLLIGASIVLAGCGGSGSSTNNPVPVASGTPTPSSTAPGPSTSDFSQTPFLLGQSAPQQFAVFGFLVAARGGPWEDVTDPSSLDDAIDIGFRIPTPDKLSLRVGSYGEGTLVRNGANGTSPSFGLVQLGFDVLQGTGSLNVAFGPDGRPLTSVAVGFWQRIARNTGEFPFDDVSFVYGVPTAPAGVPATGTVDYATAEAGQAISIDFASRSVTGSIPLAEGTYTITDCSLAAGQSAFSCRLVPGNGSAEGRIDAQLAGPDARELVGKASVSTATGKVAVLLAMGRKT